MKKIKLISIAALTLLLSGILFFSCKKDTEDPNLTYIKDFYGVNVVHSFICLNPTNDQKSLQVDLVWDEKGVATYTTTEIPRDTVNEHNGRLYMPASEIDIAKAQVSPTKAVKTVVLIYSNGGIGPVVETDLCHGYYTCSCDGAPAQAYYGPNGSGAFQYWYCYQNPGGQCYPSNLVYHNPCTGEAEELVGWQSF